MFSILIYKSQHEDSLDIHCYCLAVQFYLGYFETIVDRDEYDMGSPPDTPFEVDN